MPSLRLPPLLLSCIHGWILFNKLSSVSKEVGEKFCKAADKKVSLHWGDFYRLGDLPDFHKASKVNESFSRLLDKLVPSSHYVALSLENATKLEVCVLG